MRRWIAIGALAAMQAAAVIAYVAVEDHHGSDAPFRFDAIDQVAPDLDLERADGTRFRLDDLRGRRVLLHFWATWCPPCREELPVLEELEPELAEDGIVLLAVALDPGWEPIRRFTGRDLPPMIVRSTSTAIDRFGLSTLPDTFVVSEDGEMTARVRGARDWRSSQVRKLFVH